MHTLVAVTAGLSTPSTTRQVAELIAQAAATRLNQSGYEANITVIELRELATDLAGAMTSSGLLTPALNRAIEQVTGADGLILVTPVFKASYSGLFKMFFDAIDAQAIVGIPTVIAATAGSARHSLVLDHALRPLMSYLRATVMPTAIFAATEDFGSDQGTQLGARINKAADELARAIAGTTPTAPAREESFLGLLRQHDGAQSTDAETTM
ncbi:NAD(P)H-dependent oxidoreductase [Corynebacterium sp. zg-331]|uniref:CE1759 family FMN reductase n=1 Tax=unclassified Corynebacterium TaxID=2624378 RepID=UPI00128CDF93|nr:MULTISPECIES: CE1759 family FMN reductase [unclassified Corynebacterium]MBC3185457.1 NAD(P)H-dependent oxidoreductase [Corynebacterium sp. zg-331]MPV51952.1 oxidoreductase [Corynebacterium sp. zg331]